MLITCTCCYDLTKGTQDKDFSYSFSILSHYLALFSRLILSLSPPRISFYLSAITTSTCCCFSISFCVCIKTCILPLDEGDSPIHPRWPISPLSFSCYYWLFPQFFAACTDVKRNVQKLGTTVFEFSRHHSMGGGSIHNLTPMLSGLLLKELKARSELSA